MNGHFDMLTFALLSHIWLSVLRLPQEAQITLLISDKCVIGKHFGMLFLRSLAFIFGKSLKNSTESVQLKRGLNFLSKSEILISNRPTCVFYLVEKPDNRRLCYRHIQNEKNAHNQVFPTHYPNIVARCSFACMHL
ncbi:MAG: hypothetical protein LBT96_05095 [Campylobacteraceae bacterium]|jgi:hypothetical protein|nr:hypothetical protein [Campylobacteraceae bacterium]